mmetsp:Transcript_39154/g.85401  ORF Transcript_39154/g.85401 Transcript_39154/m.85401 type:complete len:334 (+) Transcript_39154:35-1036(+)
MAPQLAHFREIPRLGRAANGTWGESFEFLVVADPQLGMRNMDTTRAPDEEEEQYLAQTVAFANAVKPRFVVVVGDLVDRHAVEGEEHFRTQADALYKHLDQVHNDVPVLFLPGNHDIGDVPTALSMAEYKSSFGDDYFQFWASGCRFLCLNSQLLVEEALTTPELKQAADDQHQWLTKILSAQDPQPKHTVVFMHISPALDAYDEDQAYFNLPPEPRRRLVEQLRAGGVSRIFAGHFHREARCDAGDGLEIITTSAIGLNLITKPKGDRRNLAGIGGAVMSETVSGCRLVRVSATGISDEYVTVAEMKRRVAGGGEKRPADEAGPEAKVAKTE